jgi:hypothetical protein
MKRLLTITLIATLLATGAAPMAQATTRPTHPACTGPRVRWLRPVLGVAVIESRVKNLLIPCVYRHWNPGHGIALSTVQCIANRESHGYPGDYNVSGSAGVFQIIDWQARARFWLRHRWFPGHGLTPRWSFVIGPGGWADARANAIVAMLMMRSNGLNDWGGSCG